MSHRPIILTDVSVSVSGKTLISHFTTTIHAGSKIGIIGRNGTGKSMLLRTLAGRIPPTVGAIHYAKDLIIGYVPQSIDDAAQLSGGQRFNAALTEALAHAPDVLMLDEPTNHLDRENRRSLLRYLRSFAGTLIIVSHDEELLSACATTLWHLEGSGILHCSHKSYTQYLQDRAQEHAAITHEIATLSRATKEAHTKLMKEQERASNRKKAGKQRYTGEKMALRYAQAQGQATTTKNKSAIDQHKQHLATRLEALRQPEVIVPSFTLSAAQTSSDMLVSVREGSVGYTAPLISDITFAIHGKERIAILGNNGSGKSTIAKALLADRRVQRTGQWHIPRSTTIGYLDQHYHTLDPDLSAFDLIQRVMPPHTPVETIRIHLNRFLFRTNEEVFLRCTHLSRRKSTT